MEKHKRTAEEDQLLESALSRLRRAGVDTSHYTDVVIALETESRHYRDVIDQIQKRPERDAPEARASGVKQGLLEMASALMDLLLGNHYNADDGCIAIEPGSLPGSRPRPWPQNTGTPS